MRTRPGQAVSPAPGPVGTQIHSEAQDDHDDLRSLLRWVADQSARPNVEIVCAHETSAVRSPSDATVVGLTAVPLSCPWLPIWKWSPAVSPS